MKTIEERAKSAQSKMPNTSSPYVMFREGYTLGANEQQTLDEERTYNNIIKLFKENSGAEINGSWWDLQELIEFLLR